jgi:hypothetical protein
LAGCNPFYQGCKTDPHKQRRTHIYKQLARAHSNKSNRKHQFAYLPPLRFDRHQIHIEAPRRKRLMRRVLEDSEKCVGLRDADVRARTAQAAGTVRGSDGAVRQVQHGQEGARLPGIRWSRRGVQIAVVVGGGRGRGSKRDPCRHVRLQEYSQPRRWQMATTTPCTTVVTRRRWRQHTS